MACPHRHSGNNRSSRVFGVRCLNRGRKHERLNLPHRFDRRHSGDLVVLRPALILRPSEGTTPVETSNRVATVPVETATAFFQWTPVVAGAFVASAVSLILIAFGIAIGFSVVSSSPSWRDASAVLAFA